MPPSALTIQLWTCSRLRQVQPQTVLKELTGISTWLQNLGALTDSASDIRLSIKLLQTALGQLATTPSKASPFSPDQADTMFKASVPPGRPCSRITVGLFSGHRGSHVGIKQSAFPGRHQTVSDLEWGRCVR